MTGDDKVRRLVTDLYDTLSTEWNFASDAIAAAFRREPDLGHRAKALIVEQLHGLIAQSRRVNYALSAEGKSSRAKKTALARYIAWQVLTGKKTVAEAETELPMFDWPSVAAVDERIAREDDPIRRLALSTSLPDWLAARLNAEFGEDAAPLAHSFNQRATQTLRVNTLKATREGLIVSLAKQKIDAHSAPLSKTAVILDSPANVFEQKLFKDGLIEIQDEASQLVAELVEPAPGSLVIDACAGAGGKTLALGAIMKNRGRLIALDVNERRLEELRRRARRAGLSNVRAFHIAPTQTDTEQKAEGRKQNAETESDGQSWPADVAALLGKADRVLVDAPCSGIGALRRNPEARWRMAEEEIARFPAEQEAIARRAMEFVKPGGRLIYATCTMLRAENEEVVARLVAGSEFSLVLLKEIIGKKLADQITDASGKFLKLMPNKHATDGFFAAVLRRKK
jgi:16S rRNA (cytosine967-C5)-methyltransferase